MDDLKTACSKYYGSAGPTFIGFLIKCIETFGINDFSAQIFEDKKSMETCLSGQTVNGIYQVLSLSAEMFRVIKRFSLVALAGVYAYRFGILDWNEVEIVSCVRQVRDAWISDAGERKSESDRAILHLKDSFVRFDSRFMPIELEKPQGRYRDLLGYKAHDSYVLTESGLREICGDHDQRLVLRILQERGLL